MSKRKRVKVKTEFAYAWEFDGHLCRWAEPTKQQLAERFGRKKPTPEAKIVCVRLIRNRDWKRIKP